MCAVLLGMDVECVLQLQALPGVFFAWGIGVMLDLWGEW
jgi:hypothetical protein